MSRDGYALLAGPALLAVAAALVGLWQADRQPRHCDQYEDRFRAGLCLSCGHNLRGAGGLVLSTMGWFGNPGGGVRGALPGYCPPRTGRPAAAARRLRSSIVSTLGVKGLAAHEL
jgi:hypothetical protein